MKNKKYIFLIVLCIFIGFSSCSKKEINEDREESYEKGYEHGERDGYYDGYDDGYDEGYDEGFFDGYDYGYDDGSEDGVYTDNDETEYEIGYNDGFSDGYYDGATYTCLFFGDIDRAFRCAMNGDAWYTFVESYDEFVKDIYSNDDDRSKIVWSLISVVFEDDASDEEIKLVTSIFGRDLFIKNGISLDYQ